MRVKTLFTVLAVSLLLIVFAVTGIGTGVDTSTLRAVLGILRADPPASQRAGVSVPDAVRHAQEL